MTDLKAIAKQLKLPQWWVEAVSVEYLPIRHFATEEEIWKFDFDLVTERDVFSAIDKSHIVVGGTVFHNVRNDVLGSRMFGRLVSNVPVPLAADPTDICPEGLIGPHSLYFQPNPIEAWDPKLSFSQHMQVRDDDGLWQWEVARFDTSSGRWVSSAVDLGPLNEVSVPLARLRNPPVQRRPSEDGYDNFRAEFEDFYSWLEVVRRPIRESLWNTHLERKEAGWRSTVASGVPPHLSQFEDFTVRDGRMLTRLHGEPLMFRMCIQHVRQAESAIQNGELDYAISERVEAVISAAAFLEAFANVIGSETVPKWELYEKLTIEGKWQQCLANAGYPHRYDPGCEPFQTLGKVIYLRNRWLHYGRDFERVRYQHGEAVTWLDAKMGQLFVASLPDRLQELVTDMCDALGRPSPPWLHNGPGWQL